jgi:hypothetical protein
MTKREQAEPFDPACSHENCRNRGNPGDFLDYFFPLLAFGDAFFGAFFGDFAAFFFAAMVLFL